MPICNGDGVQPLAPQASIAAGQGLALAFAGHRPDGSSGPWRKAAGGPTPTGPAGQAANPQGRFTTLLESLAEAGNAPSIKKEAPAVNQEDAPRAAFWMAAPTATPPVSHPAKPADAATETQDEARTNDSLDAGRAATPETSGDAGATLAKATPQSNAALPVALATPMSPWPDAPEDRRGLPQAATQAVENGAKDSMLAAGAAAGRGAAAGGAARAAGGGGGGERAGGTAAGAEAESRQTGAPRPAAGGTPDRKPAAAEREPADGAATQWPRAGGSQDRKQAVAEREPAGEAAAQSLRAGGSQDRKQAAAEIG